MFITPEGLACSSKSQDGVSLMELLAAVSMLGIIAMIVFPAVGMGMDHYLLETTARSLAVNMRLAQSHAFTTRHHTFLVFYRFTNQYYVELSGKKEWVHIPDELRICALNFPISGGRETLSFNSTGAPNRGGHVGLENRRGDKLYVIITPVTGRVRISKTPP